MLALSKLSRYVIALNVSLNLSQVSLSLMGDLARHNMGRVALYEYEFLSMYLLVKCM